MLINYLEIGRRIKRIRKSKGKTQDELAKYINRTKSSVNRIEKGNVKIIDTLLMLSIAEYLNVDVKELVYA